MSSSGWCRRCGRPGSDSTPPPSARCRPQRRPPGGRAAPRAAAGRVAGVLDAISRPRLPDERGLLLVSYKLGDRVGARAGAGAAAGRRPGAEAGGAGRGGSGDRGGGGGRTRGAVRAGGAGGGAGPGGRLPGGGVRGPTGCWPSIPRLPAAVDHGGPGGGVRGRRAPVGRRSRCGRRRGGDRPARGVLLCRRPGDGVGAGARPGSGGDEVLAGLLARITPAGPAAPGTCSNTSSTGCAAACGYTGRRVPARPPSTSATQTSTPTPTAGTTR